MTDLLLPLMEKVNRLMESGDLLPLMMESGEGEGEGEGEAPLLPPLLPLMTESEEGEAKLMMESGKAKLMMESGEGEAPLLSLMEKVDSRID
ncbi:hypothetical protein Dimus_030881 [Dionaea muscipula]